MVLEVLGLPKLSLCVIVLCRLPICNCSAPEFVFRGAGLAEAEKCWSSSLADFLFVFSLPPKLILEVLGLPKLSVLVIVLGTLPICAFSAPKIVFRGAGLA